MACSHLGAGGKLGETDFLSEPPPPPKLNPPPTHTTPQHKQDHIKALSRPCTYQGPVHLLPRHEKFRAPISLSFSATFVSPFFRILSKHFFKPIN